MGTKTDDANTRSREPEHFMRTGRWLAIQKLGPMVALLVANFSGVRVP